MDSLETIHSKKPATKLGFFTVFFGEKFVFDIYRINSILRIIPLQTKERKVNKKQIKERSSLIIASVIISILGFIPWIFLSITAPANQALSAWFCWAIICATVGISRMFQKQNFALWVTWGIGDILVIITAVIFGGDNWAFRENLPLLVAGFSSLALSVKIGKLYPRVAESAGCIALLIGHIIIWKVWYHLPPAEPFLLLSPLCGVVAPLLGAIDEWKKKRVVTISSTVAVLVGLVLFRLMAT